VRTDRQTERYDEFLSLFANDSRRHSILEAGSVSHLLLQSDKGIPALVDPYPRV